MTRRMALVVPNPFHPHPLKLLNHSYRQPLQPSLPHPPPPFQRRMALVGLKVLEQKPGSNADEHYITFKVRGGVRHVGALCGGYAWGEPRTDGHRLRGKADEQFISFLGERGVGGMWWCVLQSFKAAQGRIMGAL